MRHVLLTKAISLKVNISLNTAKYALCPFTCSIICILVGLFMLVPPYVNAQVLDETTTVQPLPTIPSQIKTLTDKEHAIELPDTIPTDLASLTTTGSLAGVYGSISSVGSDTLATLISLWSERFKTVYPHVKFQIQASGSATAPQALTQGTATIGPMSRAMTAREISRFTQ